MKFETYFAVFIHFGYNDGLYVLGLLSTQNGYNTSNKNAFQWDAYCMLQWLSWGVCPASVCPGGLPRRVSAWGSVYLGMSAREGVCPGGCTPSRPTGRQPSRSKHLPLDPESDHLLLSTESQTGVKTLPFHNYCCEW